MPILEKYFTIWNSRFDLELQFTPRKLEISNFGLYILFIRQKVRGAMGMQKMCNFQILGAMGPKRWLYYNFISITVIWGQIILKVFEKKLCTLVMMLKQAFLTRIMII